jgi:hypothetical protein
VSANLYATLIFDFPRDNSFPGCNFAITDTVEKLDGQEIEVRETSFKFERNRVRFYLEIWTSFDDLHQPLSDETEADSFIGDKLAAAGLSQKCTILLDGVNSELVPKTELETA